MYKYAKYLLKFDHLSQQEKKDLQEEYYSQTKTSTLIEKYRLEVSATNLYKCFPPSVSKEKCPYCKFPLVHLPISRNTTDPGEQVCMLCDHSFDNEKCVCKGCEESKRQIARIKDLTERFKNEEISEYINKNRKSPVELDCLSLRDRLYIATIVKDCLTNDLKLIKPFAKCTHIRIAPTTKYIRAIYTHLLEKGIIQPSDRNHHAFTLENDTLEYDIFDIYYELNISHDDTAWSPMIKTLINPLILQTHEIEDGYKLWTEIVLHESIEYLRIQLEKSSLIYQSQEIINDKTLLELSTVTEKFSTTQMFKIIWATTNNAAAHKQKYKTSISSDTLINNITKYCNRAVENNWEIGNYSRTYHNQQTSISSIFFDQILKIGEHGFTQKASKDYLEKHIDNVGAKCQKK